MLAFPRLAIPDFLEPRLYWSSCRAVLVLTTCIGLQTIVVLMLALGPRAISTHDPASLTAAGRYFVAVEYDIQAYALGCVVTVLFAVAGLWLWNRHLHHVPRNSADVVARWGMHLLLVVASISVAVFWALLKALAPGLDDTRIVAAQDLLFLAMPGALALLVISIGVRVGLRKPSGRPS